MFVVVEKPFDDDDLYVTFLLETKHQLTTDATARTVLLNQKFNFQKIFVDMTGLGSGVYDSLMEHLPPFRVEGITFTNKTKQDMYSNLRRLLEKRFRNEKGGLHLPSKESNELAKKLHYQLADLRYELKTSSRGVSSVDDIKEGKVVSIHHSPGGHDDFADALALACLLWKDVRMKSSYSLY